MARLEAAWQESVFGLYLNEGKIEPEVVEHNATLATLMLALMPAQFAADCRRIPLCFGLTW
jgi:hypothetical protein